MHTGFLRSPQNYVYRQNDLYFGYNSYQDQQGFRHVHPMGVTTERHAITIAGAGAGKGISVIIPNLMRWQHNALVIDPKGEAAEATAEKRESMGQAIHVLDPFNVADVPERFKATLNPLDGIHETDFDARENINVLCDGMVMRSDPKAAFWDNGAMSILAGLTAFIVHAAPPENRNLPQLRESVRSLATNPEPMIEVMASTDTCGNLASGAAALLSSGGNEVKSFLSVADASTGWLDSPAMNGLLSSSTFQLSDLKTKPCTVYLVLPAHLLSEHGRFLRLFVRMALNAMAKGGTKGGERCLFLLDEFYSLGYIEEIAKAAGLMRGYGVQLWPILQDLGQLQELYGHDGAQTFFGNADLHQFFGNTDQHTLQYMSALTGTVQPHEIEQAPQAPVITRDPKNEMPTNNAEEAAYQNAMNTHQQKMAQIGRPRISTDEMAAYVSKKDGDMVASRSFNMIRGSEPVMAIPCAYFREEEAENNAHEFNKFVKEQRKGILFLLAFIMACVPFITTPLTLLGKIDNNFAWIGAVSGAIGYWLWTKCEKM